MAGSRNSYSNSNSSSAPAGERGWLCRWPSGILVFVREPCKDCRDCRPAVRRGAYIEELGGGQ